MRHLRVLLATACCLSAGCRESHVSALESEDLTACLAPAAAQKPYELKPWVEREKLLGAIQATVDGYFSISTAVHYLRLHDVLPDRDPRVLRSRQLLCGFDAVLAPILKTRSGLRFRRHVHKEVPTPAEESHVGQALATLGEVRTPISTKILVDGELATIQDLVEDLVANYYSGRFEQEWTAIALACYWPDSTWTNRFGERFDFDQLADRLLGRTARQQSCGGLHVIQALTCLLERASSRLQTSTQQRIREYLIGVFRLPESLQDDKQLRIRWLDGIPRLLRDRGPSMLVTGHSAEFMFTLMPMLQEGARPKQETIEWLVKKLRPYASMPSIPLSEICEVTHAFRAVSLAYRLAGRQPSSPKRRMK